MHRILKLIVASAALSSLSASVFAGPHPIAVPLDSFINQHVDSVAQMSRQVTLDPVVRRRLARHFHTSGPAIVSYIQNNLVLRKISRPGRYRVYCVTRTGREYVITQHLAAGTPVFVSRTTGKPILKLACGNPMVASLPPVTKTARSLESPPKLADLPTGQQAALAPGLLGNRPTTVALASPGTALAPAPVTRVAGGIYSLPAGGGRFPVGYLAGIPVLAGIITHNTGGSNGNSTGTGTSTGTTGTGTMGTGTTGTGTTGTGTAGTGTTGTGTTGTGTGTDTGTGTGTSTGTTGTGTTGTGTGVSPVPEPGTPLILAVGAAGVVLLMAAARSRRGKSRR